MDREDAWYTRYHWCLLLMSILFGLAAFCAVLTLTDWWFFPFQILLSVLSGLLVLLGVEKLGYRLVREYILPLEDAVLEKK